MDRRMRTFSFLLTLLSLLFAVKAEIFASCNTLSLQWNHTAGNVLEGTLSVTREANTEREYGKFNLDCNDNVRIVNPPPTSNILIPANVEALVNYSLELLNVTQPSSCHLRYCFTRSFEDDCTFAVPCNFTLPQSYPQWISNSYTEPVYFQWIPINSKSGDLIVTHYNIERGKEYEYGISCDGLILGKYGLTFSHTSSGDDGIRSYRVLNATLSINTTVFPTQYTCQLNVCIDGPGGCQGSYNLVIPDIDITDRTLTLRPNLLYYYWQRPSSAVELLKSNDNRINCDNIKFYWITDNTHQGRLIIQYNVPSTMHSLQGRFSVSCGAQVRQAELPVSLQRYLGTITMSFTLEYYNQDTFCSTDLCLYEGLGAKRKCSRQESYCSPIILFKNSIQEEMMVENNYVILREAELCRINTWVWVVYSGREGEAHFILEKNILAATKYGGMITLSCASLTVISLNPQSMQYVLENGGIASFIIVQNEKYSNAGSHECVLDVCALVYGGCNLIYKCYITIPVYQGDLALSSNQLNTLETCPQSLWHWRHTSSGGVLSVMIRQEDRGVISIDCNGIIVDGHNEVENTHTGIFYLIKSLHGQSPPHCNIHICVRQDKFIGCIKSFKCVVTIPSNVVPRAAQSYEEPSEELLANCEQENSELDSPVPLCSDKMWDIFYTTGYATGEVSLRINLQGNDKINEFLKISLRCSGLDLKGSTEYKLVIPKMQKETMVEFNISLPRSINEEPQTHQCTVQTQRRPKSHTEQANNTMCPTTASCSISVKTVLGRILPKCNATEGRRSIHQVYPVYNQAKVEITVSASPNNVYTVDPYCNKNNPFGHNTTEELLTNTFPSTTTGEGKVTIAISFYPECDNKTIASYFVNKRLEDCDMDVYWYCQGGEQVIESIKNMQFADEPMYCEPKSITKRLIMSLQKTFGVYSEPIAILLAILMGVASLYGLLIPASIILACCHCREKFSNNSYHECEDDEWNDDFFCEKRNSTKPLVSTYH